MFIPPGTPPLTLNLSRPAPSTASVKKTPIQRVHSHEARVSVIKEFAISHWKDLERTRNQLNHLQKQAWFSFFERQVALWNNQTNLNPFQKLVKRILNLFCNQQRVGELGKLFKEIPEQESKLKNNEKSLEAEFNDLFKDWKDPEFRAVFSTPQEASLFLLKELCLGTKSWEALPELKFSLPLNEMANSVSLEEASIVRGMDSEGRAFIAIQTLETVDITEIKIYYIQDIDGKAAESISLTCSSYSYIRPGRASHVIDDPAENLTTPKDFERVASDILERTRP